MATYVYKRTAHRWRLLAVMLGAVFCAFGSFWLLEATGASIEQCGYIGDDVIDLPLLMKVGFAVTVPSGHPEVQHRAHYVTRAPGGRGAVREVCDMVMRAQGTYEQALAPYFA